MRRLCIAHLFEWSTSPKKQPGSRFGGPTSPGFVAPNIEAQTYGQEQMEMQVQSSTGGSWRARKNCRTHRWIIKPDIFFWLLLDCWVWSIRIFQDTPGTYPRPPSNSLCFFWGMLGDAWDAWGTLELDTVAMTEVMDPPSAFSRMDLARLVLAIVQIFGIFQWL